MIAQHCCYSIVFYLIASVHCLPVERSKMKPAFSFTDGVGLRWKNAIVPYAFTKDSEYSEQQLSVIREVMDYIESKSCVKFVTKSKHHGDYLEISEPGDDCSSEVGRIGGKQTMHLNAKYCMQKGKILHELMHTLGFIHEHSRSDRDQYVLVDWDNIQDEYEHNFEITTVNVNANQYLNASYDYESVMHYKTDSYVVDLTKPSIAPRKRVDFAIVGKSKTLGVLSDGDVKKLNAFYHC